MICPLLQDDGGCGGDQTNRYRRESRWRSKVLAVTVRKKMTVTNKKIDLQKIDYYDDWF